MEDAMESLKSALDSENFRKLAALKNPEIERLVAQYIEHCTPDNVFVCTDSKEDREYIVKKTLETREERTLATSGHTIHYDGPKDQGRDRENTRLLLPEGVSLGENIKSMERTKGVAEVNEILKGSMKGHEMFVLFFSLAPNNSPFSIPCLQLTDSCYVAHSEHILYRTAYEQFKNHKGGFFTFIHSQGELANGVCKNIGKRRIYMDMPGNTVYSTNTQYAGNTVGLKKLAMRLGIQKASKEGWLTEHMFIVGSHAGKRVTYFLGAFPSACGKTSTAMLKGETIIGDDIAYLKVMDGVVRAVNVEKGIFGIIQDVNEQDDPVIWGALTNPGEVIFSNVLIDERGYPHWLGDKRPQPPKGVNYQGEWQPGKKDANGKDVKMSHPNARYTIALAQLKNKDARMDDPGGVEVGGIIYGGRDADTSVPVYQSFSWEHGIVAIGATIESETTTATIGQEGVREFNPMSNLDFLSISIGRYIQDNLDFGKKAKKQPFIYGVNYFLKGKDGKYLNGMKDKHVWLKWMDERVNNEAGAIETPIGFIPKHEDLKRLFKEVLNREYSKEAYNEQFKIRVLELIAKIDRIHVIYREKVPDTPPVVFKILDEQRQRLEALRKAKGDYVLPEDL
jgi:phosphoenolpyruvate carboxykinase (GTP)